MQYFGGKQGISKPLSQFLNSQLKDGQPFVDLFCGSCNVITKIDDNRERYANDKQKYLIAMWNELQKGWQPPTSLSEEEYKYIRENKDEKPYLTGFVGFGCSFAGRWFCGYARNKTGTNYCRRANNSCKKKNELLNGVLFSNFNYDEVDIPFGSLVYCDIPYKNTTQYCSSEVGKFNHDEFYKWVKENSSKYEIYISEYEHNLPDGFEIVWRYESSKSIRNKNDKREKTVEILMRYCG